MLQRGENPAQSVNREFGSGVTKTIACSARSAVCLDRGTQFAVNEDALHEHRQVMNAMRSRFPRLENRR
jgi:hypothetical protein